MRILSIRIRNLNSLSGDWTIRLDAPEYEADGIFAITGPTGAGKSTILDAVCLALYGRTPRLDKVTRSSNEIMSRQAWECLAEVCFRTPHGEYRCCWTQNRAGRNTTGNLQQPRHRLYDRDGLSLAEKTTDVVARVTELTGMDFSRFTQSMLLAQGRFASFLLADGDERAPLLEQITGTGIYSEISRCVHERNRAEQLRLTALQEELASRNLLTEEEENGIVQERQAVQLRTAELSRRELALRDDLSRVERSEALAREEETLNRERQELARKGELFAPERERLALARRAAKLSGVIEAISVRRDEQRSDGERRRTLADALPRLIREEQTAREALAAAGDRLKEERQSVDARRETWNRVRAMDTERDTRRRELSALTQELAARNDALATCRQQHDSAAQALKQAEEALERLGTEKAALGADAALADAVGAMEARLSLLRQEDRSLTQARQHLAGRRQQLTGLEETLNRHRSTVSALEKDYTAAAEMQAGAERELTALLQDRELSAWRARHDVLTARRSALEQAVGEERSRLELLQGAGALKEQRQHLALAVEREQAELASGRSLLAERRERLALQQKILAWEEERRLLREGSPCPLCGALHHPFAEPGAEPPRPDDSGIADLERHLERLTTALAAHQRDIEHTDSALNDHADSLARCTERRRQALAALSPRLAAALGGPQPQEEAEDWEGGLLGALALDQEVLPLLESLLSGTGTQLDAVNALLRQAEAQEQSLRALTRRTEELRRQHEAALNAAREAETQALRLRTETDTLTQDLAARERKDAENRAALRADLSRLAAPEGDSLTKLCAAVLDLTRRRDRYAALLEQERQAAAACGENGRRLAVTAQALSAAEQERNNTRLAHEARSGELAALDGARKALFGLRIPDEEEKSAVLRLGSLTEEEERCRDVLERCSRALTEGRSEAAALNERMSQRASALRDMESELESRLAAEGFESEAACRAALLPEETFLALGRTEQALADSAVSLDARAEDLRRRKEEQTLPLPSREDTERNLAAVGEEREQSLRQLGILQEKLNANNARRMQALLLREKAGAQAEICRRWSALNELIGSSDGKKFRNYAQSLTFRRLILMANRQLASMTDRYLLTPSTTEELTLNVIDRYQADVVRSSRNLSGGESFLVSLALALGLAQMAGRNVRVDSVFLDEGFGTLDEESLGTALDMLASLRQKGKMIGIISHIQTVCDRISAQIRVSPEGGGRSRLSGPGVSETGRQEA